MDDLHAPLTPELTSPELTIPELNAEDLMADLTASVALIQHQTERLAQLERALDQTLLQVEEARSQLVRQEWIEHQLAATEEFANVQQQAIHHLKGRLDEDDSLPEPIPTVPVTSIATPSERLEVRYVQAQQQIQALSQKLREESIQPPEMEVVDEEELEEAWWQSQLLSLETEISKHFQTQAFLQQACAELEQERDHNQVRILELEHQTNEMQEQILRQAQQTSEYETAIQHWKDRFYQSQNQMLTVRELFDQMSDPSMEAIADILELLPMPTPSEQMQSLRRAVPRRSDLPEFLQRRRGFRK
ncbi:MAG: hypothetical protein H7237_04310 [Alkalinema sp. FL-bin-369]|nr:hypothetical protein [Leptolyngbyaceae cyanobacterium LF-bin-369]